MRPRQQRSDRESVARLRAIICAGTVSHRAPLSPAEQAAEDLRSAALAVQAGGDLGVYMSGGRLQAYRRIEALGKDLEQARHYGAPDLDERIARAVAEAWTVAEPWRERWD